MRVSSLVLHRHRLAVRDGPREGAVLGGVNKAHDLALDAQVPVLERYLAEQGSETVDVHQSSLRREEEEA